MRNSGLRSRYCSRSAKSITRPSALFRSSSTACAERSRTDRWCCPAMRQQLVEPTGWLQRQAIAAVVRAGFGCTSMTPEAKQLPDDFTRTLGASRTGRGPQMGRHLRVGTPMPPSHGFKRTSTSTLRALAPSAQLQSRATALRQFDLLLATSGSGRTDAFAGGRSRPSHLRGQLCGGEAERSAVAARPIADSCAEGFDARK